MTKEDLRGQLTELHKELENASHVEAADKDILGHVMTDLVKIASGQPLQAGREETLKEHLEQQAADFETRHPRLARITREVMDILAKLGI